MTRALAIACAICLTLTGTLYAFSREIPEADHAAFADATRNVTSCEFASCGCLGLRCSCFECGGK